MSNDRMKFFSCDKFPSDNSHYIPSSFPAQEPKVCKVLEVQPQSVVKSKAVLTETPLANVREFMRLTSDTYDSGMYALPDTEFMPIGSPRLSNKLYEHNRMPGVAHNLTETPDYSSRAKLLYNVSPAKKPLAPQEIDDLDIPDSRILQIKQRLHRKVSSQNSNDSLSSPKRLKPDDKNSKSPYDICDSDSSDVNIKSECIIPSLDSDISNIKSSDEGKHSPTSPIKNAIPSTVCKSKGAIAALAKCATKPKTVKVTPMFNRVRISAPRSRGGEKLTLSGFAAGNRIKTKPGNINIITSPMQVEDAPNCFQNIVYDHLDNKANNHRPLNNKSDVIKVVMEQAKVIADSIDRSITPDCISVSNQSSPSLDSFETFLTKVNTNLNDVERLNLVPDDNDSLANISNDASMESIQHVSEENEKNSSHDSSSTNTILEEQELIKKENFKREEIEIELSKLGSDLIELDSKNGNELIDNTDEKKKETEEFEKDIDFNSNKDGIIEESTQNQSPSIKFSDQQLDSLESIDENSDHSELFVEALSPSAAPSITIGCDRSHEIPKPLDTSSIVFAKCQPPRLDKTFLDKVFSEDEVSDSSFCSAVASPADNVDRTLPDAITSPKANRKYVVDNLDASPGETNCESAEKVHEFMSDNMKIDLEENNLVNDIRNDEPITELNDEKAETSLDCDKKVDVVVEAFNLTGFSTTEVKEGIENTLESAVQSSKSLIVPLSLNENDTKPKHYEVETTMSCDEEIIKSNETTNVGNFTALEDENVKSTRKNILNSNSEEEPATLNSDIEELSPEKVNLSFDQSEDTLTDISKIEFDSESKDISASLVSDEDSISKVFRESTVNEDLDDSVKIRVSKIVDYFNKSDSEQSTSSHNITKQKVTVKLRSAIPTLNDTKSENLVQTKSGKLISDIPGNTGSLMKYKKHKTFTTRKAMFENMEKKDSSKTSDSRISGSSKLVGKISNFNTGYKTQKMKTLKESLPSDSVNSDSLTMSSPESVRSTSSRSSKRSEPNSRSYSKNLSDASTSRKQFSNTSFKSMQQVDGKSKTKKFINYGGGSETKKDSLLKSPKIVKKYLPKASVDNRKIDETSKSPSCRIRSSKIAVRTRSSEDDSMSGQEKSTTKTNEVVEDSISTNSNTASETTKNNLNIHAKFFRKIELQSFSAECNEDNVTSDRNGQNKSHVASTSKNSEDLETTFDESDVEKKTQPKRTGKSSSNSKNKKILKVKKLISKFEDK